MTAWSSAATRQTVAEADHSAENDSTTEDDTADHTARDRAVTTEDSNRIPRIQGSIDTHRWCVSSENEKVAGRLDDGIPEGFDEEEQAEVARVEEHDERRDERTVRVAQFLAVPKFDLARFELEEVREEQP